MPENLPMLPNKRIEIRPPRGTAWWRPSRGWTAWWRPARAWKAWWRTAWLRIFGVSFLYRGIPAKKGYILTKIRNSWCGPIIRSKD